MGYQIEQAVEAIRNFKGSYTNPEDGFMSYLKQVADGIDVPGWRFAEALAEEGLPIVAGQLSEDFGNHESAALYFAAGGDTIGQRRCLKKQKSTMMFGGQVVPNYEQIEL